MLSLVADHNYLPDSTRRLLWAVDFSHPIESKTGLSIKWVGETSDDSLAPNGIDTCGKRIKRI